MSSLSIRRAIISVSDKSGILEFAKLLQASGVEILSSGGTAQYLRDNQISLREISEYTQQPELFSGRVKTLHPRIHGGILYQRENTGHISEAEKNQILPIDLVIVNLYPFEKTISRSEISEEEAIEQIDIGGPSMLRSAAKNFHSVLVIADVSDYSSIMEEFKNSENQISLETRKKLAIKAFEHTSYYDQCIFSYFSQKEEREILCLNFPYSQSLRYGDNPHQKATFFTPRENLAFEKLQGKELSYTNLLDIESAIRLLSEFSEPTVAILKHTNPCGVGTDKNLSLAWEKAFATDRQAPFGGVVSCNVEITPEFAEILKEIFLDVIVAPKFSEKAKEILSQKPNTRLIGIPSFSSALDSKIYRSLLGGIVQMDADLSAQGLDTLKIVTERTPTPKEKEAMNFAWKIVKNIKSNAIVLAKEDRTLGIGAGQMSRLDSSNFAIQKAQNASFSLENSIVASDAFFPFADGLQVLIDAGISACIQPGGSIRDEEVIQAANQANIAMAFTQIRHFLH